MDRTVRQLASHISKKVADRLSSFYQTEQEKFLSAWADIELIIKLGVLQDEKFYERAKDFLIWKNLKGEWTTLEKYLDQHREEYKNKIFYTADDKQTSAFLNLYKDKGIEVLYANSYVDAALMNTLENKLSPLKFQRIDGAIDETILDAKKEKTLLDEGGKTEGARMADFIRSSLNRDTVQVEAKSLASDQVPAFIVLDE
jgi:molecular chaperone HtpG